MAIASTAARLQVSHRRGTARLQHLAAFALTGLLLTLVFPRPGWSWLAYIALVPATVTAARTHSLRMLAWTSALVFAMWWGWMARWLWPVTGAGLIAMTPVLGAYAAAGWLMTAVLHRRGSLPLAVALPLGWVSVEAIRCVWPVGGFAWFTLAHSQAAWQPGSLGRVVQVADLFGQHTVGLVVAMVNGCIADLLVGHRKQRRPVLVVTVTVLAASIAYGQWRLSQFDDITTPGPVVAVVQTDVPQDNKIAPTAESLGVDWVNLIALHRQATASTAGGGSRPGLIVWPETVIPGPLNRTGSRAYSRVGDDPTTDPETRVLYGRLGSFYDVVPRLIAERSTPTLAGAGTVTFDPEMRRYNSVYFYNAAGSPLDRPYHKSRLVPFGEYIPGPQLTDRFFSWLFPVAPYPDLGRGDGPRVFNLPGVGGTGPTRFATPICFEDTVASVCRRMVYHDGEKRLDALVNLTNDGWFGSRDGGLAAVGQRRQHTQLASLRCIENRVPMTRAVNSGISGFIDSLGRPGPQLGVYEAGVATHRLTIDPRRTLYSALGGIPVTLMVAATLAATVYLLLFGKARRRMK